MNLKWNLILFCIFIYNYGYADTFFLKDGKKIIGTQIERTKKTIVYKDTKGVTKTIPVDKIKSVTIDKKKEIVVENYKILDKKESGPTLSELSEKIQTLTDKVDELSEKNKELSEIVK